MDRHNCGAGRSDEAHGGRRGGHGHGGSAGGGGMGWAAMRERFFESRRGSGRCGEEGEESMFEGGKRGWGGRGFGFGGPDRGERPLEQGDLRWLALDLIATQPRHGYEIIKAISDALNGQYSPSPGAVYPMLTLLEETGLIASEEQGSKKLYQLTDAGRAEIETNKAAIESARGRLNRAHSRSGGAPAPELMRAMDNLRGALHVRLSRGGLSPEALAAITAAIDRAAADIERS